MAAALVALGVTPPADTQSWVIALPPMRALSVEVTVGDVEIRGESRQDASVEITRLAPQRAQLPQIPISVQETPEQVAIIATQRDGQTNPALRTDVRLRVPRGAILRAINIVEGHLRASELDGAITADVRRGSINASAVTGAVRLETGIGSITAERIRLSARGVLRFRAFNGDLRLTLAERPSNARVMALALNGTIVSDIPLRTKEGWGPRWGEATLGNGEPVISFDVVTGTIVIKAP